MENMNQPNYAVPNTATLQTLSKWAGFFVGIMSIIIGAFTCLGAIGTFGLSLIPGVITIVMGVKLRNAKASIEKYLAGGGNELNNIFENLGTYFKIQGILYIITIVLTVLGILFAGVFMAAMFSNF
jgi:hypothetical protein